MHSKQYLKETADIAAEIDPAQIEQMAEALSKIKGRIYCIGLGGSLANAIHMAADFRKLCHLDAIAPNQSEMSAWANDHGQENQFAGFLKWIKPGDALFVLSVGGGTSEFSAAISDSVKYAQFHSAVVFGIVGPHGGVTAEHGEYVIRIPANSIRVTPHTEAFQAVIWHCLVSHPILQKAQTTW